MTVFLLVLLGGAGAVARLMVDGEIRLRWPARFPWATGVINVSGSLVLGILAGVVIYRGASTDLKLVLGTGFCGGFTTFSTATIETVRLVQQRRGFAALSYSLGTAGLTLGAGALGLLLVR